MHSPAFTQSSDSHTEPDFNILRLDDQLVAVRPFGAVWWKCH